jgi:hypothetical protein
MRARVVRIGLALALLAVAVALAQDDAGVRRLAERLVGVWGDPGTMRVSLHAGALPPEMPYELPLPASFDVVGSVAREERGVLSSVQVVLDGPERTEEAFAALQGAFAAAGWTVFSDAGMIGFVPSQVPFSGRACGPLQDDEHRPLAFITVMWVPDGPSDVRLETQARAWPGACVAWDGEPWFQAPLPTLSAPPGTTLLSPTFSADGDGDAAIAVAVLRGADAIAAVVEHYETQLLATGWTRLRGGVTDAFGTRSRWSRSHDGRDWTATLAVDWPAGDGPLALQFAVVAASAGP